MRSLRSKINQGLRKTFNALFEIDRLVIAIKRPYPFLTKRPYLINFWKLKGFCTSEAINFAIFNRNTIQKALCFHALTIVVFILCCQPAIAAEPEDKDFTILQLKKSNLEFAMENILLQSEVLKQKYKDAQAQYEKVKAEVDEKEKEKKPQANKEEPARDWGQN